MDEKLENLKKMSEVFDKEVEFFLDSIGIPKSHNPQARDKYMHVVMEYCLGNMTLTRCLEEIDQFLLNDREKERAARAISN